MFITRLIVQKTFIVLDGSNLKQYCSVNVKVHKKGYILIVITCDD
jgi:hypothetical protein